MYFSNFNFRKISYYKRKYGGDISIIHGDIFNANYEMDNLKKRFETAAKNDFEAVKKIFFTIF